MVTAPPFHADHIGSLLRPRVLKDAVKSRASGKLDQEAFEQVVDNCVVEAIRLQEEAGMPAITDGEFRRGSWFLGFVDAVDGLTTAPSTFEFKGSNPGWECPYAERRLERGRGITTHEFEFVRAHTDRTPKVTMPSPTAMHFWRADAYCAPRVYPDLDSYFADLAKLYRQELADLASLGCTYVQLDEVPIAMLCDQNIRAAVRGRGDDPDRMLRLYVELINEALADRPDNMFVGMHLCRGNYKGQHMASGGYGPVSDTLFGKADVDAFFLEYDTDRAGGFEPLDAVADTKSVILGLVTTKTPDNPDAGALKRRIEEASRYVPLDRLGLSPQCGFASSAAGNPVTEADERSKLALVATVAQDVWG